ncbi:MAG: pentapeptide repeat-containing protein [Endozoicomonas sp.]|uniref:pentapeptide repeat-containing protein n=1 Tax=Endozoicomonas sp. TaxID=1892382 RepID=UPI003D9B7413
MSHIPGSTPPSQRPQNDYVTSSPKSGSADNVPNEKVGQLSGMQVRPTDVEKQIPEKKSEDTKTPQKLLAERDVVEAKGSRFPRLQKLLISLKKWAARHHLYTPRFEAKSLSAEQLGTALKQWQGNPKVQQLLAGKQNMLDMSGLRLSSGFPENTKLSSFFADGSGKVSLPVVLKQVDFSGADLSHLDLTDVIFEECDFSHATLNRTKMGNAACTRCNFDSANMQGLVASNLTMGDCSLTHAKMSSASMTDCVAYGCKVDSHTDLTSAVIKDSDIRGIDVGTADFSHAKMTNTKINRLALGHTLAGATLDTVKYGSVVLPTEVGGVNSLTLRNMKLHLGVGRGDANMQDPVGKMYHCHFENCDVKMHGYHYIAKDCTFSDCDHLSLQVGERSMIEGCTFTNNKGMEASRLGYSSSFSDNTLSGCNFPSKLLEHVRQKTGNTGI